MENSWNYLITESAVYFTAAFDESPAGGGSAFVLNLSVAVALSPPRPTKRRMVHNWGNLVIESVTDDEH